MTRLAYLLNQYPMTSTTFIREEVRAHEAAGIPIKRFAIRRWSEPLVEAADRAEAEATEYLLEAGAGALLRDLALELLTNPFRLLRAAGVSLRMAVNSRGKAIRNLAYFVEAVRFKRRAVACGITHVHAHFSTNAAAVALLSERLGGPGYSFTVHGPDELEETAQNSLTLKARHARAVATISDYCRAFVLDHVTVDIADRTHIVRCGIDPGDFALRDTVVGPGNQRLVCVGRLSDAKQQIRLPDVAAALKVDFPDLRFVMIGDGDRRAEIEAQVDRLDVRDQFEFRGWADKAAIKAALTDGRAMILPSLAEGLPVAIMEALSLGCPVVTTAITGIPELVDDSCGWLVPPRDTDALIAAVRDCLAAPADEIAAKGREGRARVIAMHDQATNAATLRRVIDGA